MGFLKKLFSKPTGSERQESTAVKETEVKETKVQEEKNEVSEEQAKRERLQLAVKEVLDSRGWSYMKSERGDFRLTVRLDGGLQRCTMHIHISDADAIQTTAGVNLIVPDNRKEDMIELLSRANDGRIDGAFEYNIDTGEIRYATCLIVAWDLPPAESIEVSIDMTTMLLEKYSNAIINTINGIGDPKTNSDAAEN